MQPGRRFATRTLVAVLLVGLMSACGAEGGGSAQGGSSTTTDPKTSTTAEDDFEVTEGYGAFGDDCFSDDEGHGPDCDEEALEECFIDEDGHGPDCDPATEGGAVGVDECFIDEHGHGPDCADDGRGGPDDLRFLSGWDTDGSSLDVGTVFTLTCEPNGTPGEVWGTDPYSDDSSLCTAAVHAGKITVRDGGTVGGQRIDSRRTLPGGQANGINAQPADNWRGAIEFF